LFGWALGMSNDGRTLVVSAREEGSDAVGVNGNQSNNLRPGSGAAYVFSYGTSWTQDAYLKASRTYTGMRFGSGVAVSGDGNVVAIGAAQEDSPATGVNGSPEVDPLDLSGTDSGAVYLFARNAGAWQPQDYSMASNTNDHDNFGVTVALDDSGSVLAVGATGEDSGTLGINGNASDNSVAGAGAVYVFQRSGGPWAQRNYLKSNAANSPGLTVNFGYSISLTGDGNSLAIGLFSDSAAAGVGSSTLNDHNAFGAGGVQLY
jgi:hypothetical protein